MAHRRIEGKFLCATDPKSPRHSRRRTDRASIHDTETSIELARDLHPRLSTAPSEVAGTVVLTRRPETPRRTSSIVQQTSSGDSERQTIHRINPQTVAPQRSLRP